MSKPNKRKGYKHTSLGWIPEDWESSELIDFVFKKNGKYDPTIKSESKPCIELEHIEKETGQLLGYTDAKEQASIKNIFERGDVLFGKLRPYLQKYWFAQFEGVCSSEIWVLNGIKTRCTNKFLFYLVQTNRFVQAANVTSGSKMPRADWDYLSSFPFILPPLPEQKAIAAVLSTWDTAIETTQKLIEQKERRKKALMQQLLSDKKRLKGFDGKWKEVRLGDITKKISRRNKELLDAKVYSVTNTNGFVLQSEHFEREIAGEDLSNYKIIKKHEFAYNPARVNVGSLAYFENEVGLISSLYVCFKTNGEVLDYILHLILQLDHTKHRISSFGEGGVRIYLWYELFAKIKVMVPPLPEQEAIAKVLRVADKELNLLRSKLDFLKEQKKGLMQKLLTGQVRVKAS
ncbi:MAG: restriction endonuclease subunit S [Bacteroidota bacterium]